MRIVSISIVTVSILSISNLSITGMFDMATNIAILIAIDVKGRLVSALCQEATSKPRLRLVTLNPET